MKKFYILLLALAFAAMLAVPATAAEISADGEYTFGGEAVDVDADDMTYNTYYDELDLNLDFESGDVHFHWDVEITEDDYFDKQCDPADGTGETEVGGFCNPNKLVDKFWVAWQAMENLTFKAGEYGIGWGNDLITDTYGESSGTFGVMYSLDMADIALFVSKDDEGVNGTKGAPSAASEDDNETIMVTVEAADLGPISTLGLIIIQTTNDLTGDDDTGMIGVVAGANIGPVSLDLEFGQMSSDNDADDGGNVIFADIGLEGLVGFGLNIGVLTSNEEWNDSPVYGNDFDFMEIFDVEGPEAQLLRVTAEYGVNDNLTISGAVLVSSEIDGDDAGTEVDVQADYSFSDNVSYSAGYAQYSEGDAPVGDRSKLWHEFVFEF